MRGSASAGEFRPFRHLFAASVLSRPAVGEVAFGGEVVANVGICRRALLQRFHASEPRHHPLTAAEGEVPVIYLIVGVAADFPTINVAELAHRRGRRLDSL